MENLKERKEQGAQRNTIKRNIHKKEIEEENFKIESTN